MPPSFSTDADGSARSQRPATLQVHLDLLGRLHRLFGAFALLCGLSLVILAAGTSAGLRSLGQEGPAGHTGVVILAFCAAIAIIGGLGLFAAGRALDRRSKLGRFSALVFAVPNLVVVPFGTALSVYAFWVLLNDEARGEFGRPPRTPGRTGEA
jgi:hypothetical protein